jgi:preprotein translocase subunit SecA
VDKEAKEKLGKTLYDPDDPWILELLNALQYIFKLNKDYIVLNNKILRRFSGRIMEDRR